MEGDKKVRVRISRILVLASLMFCTFLCLNPGFRELVEFPESNLRQVNLTEPQFQGIWSHLITEEKVVENRAVSASASGGLDSVFSEKVDIVYKLFGIIPIRAGEVEVMSPMKLIPGGQSIGVSLQTKGVLVVGQAAIQDQSGRKIYPAREAGIEVGDILLKINNQDMHTDQDVSNAVNQAGQQNGQINVVYKHLGQILEKTLSPVFCSETGRYRVGLFVRDEAAGVGTLSFIDPATKEYGALGHVITDADTNQKIEVSDGKIMASTIYSVQKGKRGQPGEKIGSFVPNSPFSGTIEKNTQTGIFGKFNGKVSNPYFKEPIPVGWESEVKVGPAKIYTVKQGEKIEEFNISIDRIMHNRTDSKNMIIRVTDPKPLQATGGIIQGMSGSPIVQDGKIVGAVTHVFVNDSTRGYGVFIQNMMSEGIEKKQAA